MKEVIHDQAPRYEETALSLKEFISAKSCLSCCSRLFIYHTVISPAKKASLSDDQLAGSKTHIYQASNGPENVMGLKELLMDVKPSRTWDCKCKETYPLSGRNQPHSFVKWWSTKQIFVYCINILSKFKGQKALWMCLKAIQYAAQKKKIFELSMSKANDYKKACPGFYHLSALWKAG